MALNLVRNSRVYFTTNVDSSTGVINTSGFSTSNTQEIQVLDGFTFSQKTNQDTVTISEAGTDPTRGQRSFNTSLAPVDFSFSTYVRPATVSSAVAAEESVLWNALFSTRAIDSGVAIGGTGATYTWAASTGTGQLALSSLSFTPTATLAVNDAVIIGGITNSDATIQKALNGAAIVKSITGSSPVTAITLEYVAPYPGSATPTVSATTTKIFNSAGWASTKLDTTNTALSTVAGSNKNRLQKFGMIFVVDNVTYAVDNCAMNQVTLDFGLDAIATLAWTGQATALRDVTSAGGLVSTISGNVSTITGITSTENLFVGQTVAGTSSGSASLGTSPTITSVGANSITVTGTSPVAGTFSSIKVTKVLQSGNATLSTYTGTGPWTMTLTGLSTVDGVSVGDAVTATNGGTGDTVGSFGSGNTAVVQSIESSTSIKITITGSTTPTSGTSNAGSGQVTSVTATIATLGFTSGLTGLTAAAKNITAPFITNKLSTVSFKTLNALGSAAAKTYTIALTGGSVTINNNISYITPANLGVVNVPAVYYTGTRAITGTMNAYLKTGASETGTGQLLLDMLAAASSTIEPMAALTIAIGGSTNSTKVELDMPSVSFSIPSIDVQQVISTSINFTAAGSMIGATAGNSFAIDKLNDLTVRYYAA